MFSRKKSLVCGNSDDGLKISCEKLVGSETTPFGSRDSPAPYKPGRLQENKGNGKRNWSQPTTMEGCCQQLPLSPLLKSLALPAAQSRFADGVGEWNRRAKPTIRKTCVVGKTRKKNPMPTASCSSNWCLATVIVAVRTGKPWAMGP